MHCVFCSAFQSIYIIINFLQKNAVGILLTLLVAGIAELINFSAIELFSFKIGGVTLSIIIGILVSNIFTIGDKFSAGIKFSEKKILALAIALMGVKLDFTVVEDLGVKIIVMVASAMVFTILIAHFLGKFFKLENTFALLLGIGNSVCGSSAIAATAPIVKAKEEEIGLSVALVNFLGTLAIFLLPFIARVLFNFSDINAGILIGNTVQAVGQVTAAGFSINEATGEWATVVKMGRILMLTPLVLVLIYGFRGKMKGAVTSKTFSKGFPNFIFGFLLLSLVPTFSLLSPEYIKIISKISHYALMIAMAGIGLKIKFSTILKQGSSALMIGSLIFLLQIAFSLVFLLLFF